jgi:DNA-binding NtrC family response regulator
MAAARILVVDDDLMMLGAVSGMLRRAGYEVLPADGPRQALEIVRNNSAVDLVVSDISMPEMPGPQLVHEIAELSPQTAGVLMTGAVLNSADVPDGVPVLKKPFALRDLISAVKAALARAEQLSVEFQHQRERSVELKQQSEALRSEAPESFPKTLKPLTVLMIFGRSLRNKGRENKSGKPSSLFAELPRKLLSLCVSIEARTR